jgi:hypothetical protein
LTLNSASGKKHPISVRIDFAENLLGNLYQFPRTNPKELTQDFEGVIVKAS